MPVSQRLEAVDEQTPCELAPADGSRETTIVAVCDSPDQSARRFVDLEPVEAEVIEAAVVLDEAEEVVEEDGSEEDE